MAEMNLKSSMLMRMVIILLLFFVLFIPAIQIESLIKERAQRRAEAVMEVSSKWAYDQTITGPVLTIPVKRTMQDKDGKRYIEVHRYNLLPETVAYDADLKTEVRYRGIYQAVLYNMKLKASGGSNLQQFKIDDMKDSAVMWNDAYITVGISDLRGIKDNIALSLNNNKLSARSGVQSNDMVASGISFFPGNINNGMKYDFNFDMNLNGSSSVSFVPVGRHTEVNVRSSWPTPSFNGLFLPDQRTIDKKGFSAKWKILELNRNFPQAWINNAYKPDTSRFGVILFESVDQYQQTLRTAKYAIMIIALTFLAFILSEIIGKELLHPVHYTFVGFALLLFYLLLLSLSEHLGFGPAYILSSLAVLIPVTLYSRAILHKKKISLLVGMLLLLLYIFFYILLQLEDFTLLIGSIVLLIILSAAMYLTRKINWFTIKNE